jgi:hypothetical protein
MSDKDFTKEEFREFYCSRCTTKDDICDDIEKCLTWRELQLDYTLGLDPEVDRFKRMQEAYGKEEGTSEPDSG